MRDDRLEGIACPTEERGGCDDLHRVGEIGAVELDGKFAELIAER